MLWSERSGESERASGREEKVVGDNFFAEPPVNNEWIWKDANWDCLDLHSARSSAKRILFNVRQIVFKKSRKDWVENSGEDEGEVRKAVK